jgi:CRP-like cAMP-binding protein
MTRTVVRDLKAWGLSGNDIAAVLKVSPQRVSQLAKSERRETRSAKPARSVTVSSVFHTQRETGGEVLTARESDR